MRVGLISRIVIQVQHFWTTVNLFNSESPHEHIQRHERRSTRVYMISLVILIAFLFIYMLFVENTRTVIMKSPSSNLVAQLQKKYPMTLSCPCVQTSMSYSTFLSLKVTDRQHLGIHLKFLLFSLKVLEYHPICSSSFLSRNYLEALLGENLVVVPESTSFKRQFLVAQLSLLASYCVLTNETVNVSLTLFLRQQFITAQALTADQFFDQINITIDRFLLGMFLSLRHSLDYIEAITHGNTIMSTYVSNWRFIPGSVPSSSTIRTRPVWYGNCSCARSTQCSLPMTIDNISFPGLSIGCLPSSVLLQSTFECFYNQTCLNSLHYALFDNVRMTSLPVSINMSSYSPSDAPIHSLLNKLFIERWFRQYDYEAFFQTCAVSKCTYTYIQQTDILYVVTAIIGLFGGLTIVLRLICPLFIIGFMKLIDSIRNQASTSVQM